MARCMEFLITVPMSLSDRSQRIHGEAWAGPSAPPHAIAVAKEMPSRHFGETRIALGIEVACVSQRALELIEPRLRLREVVDAVKVVMLCEFP